jgi:RecA-family ATPase
MRDNSNNGFDTFIDYSPPTAPPDWDDRDQHLQPKQAETNPPLPTITPAKWQGTAPVEQRWLAQGRIPADDLTLFTGNGGSGKTETAIQLCISVSAQLGDWLGCVVEAGPALFVSLEEQESDIRSRIERICKHRSIDPHGITDLHLTFPDLEGTWLAMADRYGRVIKTPLLIQIEQWIAANLPSLVVIDNVAAAFGAEAIDRRQVRAFLAMLRRTARRHGAAMVLLDHPSVRGMTDGSGTANSVDWRNSVRAMLHLSDPDKDDPDARTLEVKKLNYGRSGERVKLRWSGLTFTTAATAAQSVHRAKAEREIDELFLKLLDKRNAQGRPVRPSSGRGSAPHELAADPEANGVTADAFRASMERLFTAGKIITKETGPASRKVKHIDRVS